MTMVHPQIRPGIYGRVSSDQQAEAGTIASQVEALKERIAADGLSLDSELCFLDEGYSGNTLVRPALERLRDCAAAGAIDRLYVHSPDRLARKYAYQVLLVDELKRHGVELVFLNRELGRTPEDDLLLQVQGMVAEYERAKILERSRRGKLHAARKGNVNVLSGAPYGYRYVSKQEGDGQARYEIVLEEARVVRQIFTWVGQDRCSIGEVCRRLKEQKVPSPKGKCYWDRTTVWGILKNPAYRGVAGFGKTQIGELRKRLRGQRGRAEQPRRAYSVYDTPERAVAIPVPALVSEELFAVVAEQLEENRRRQRQRARGARYLLQGLLVCAQCGYAYYGKPVSRRRIKGSTRRYAYYRCTGTDAYRFGGERICQNKQVRTDLLEEAVWDDVCALLKDPGRLEAEYQRRFDNKTSDKEAKERAKSESLIQKVKRGIARLIDAYGEGLVDKEEFEPRIRQFKERLARLEAEANKQAELQAQEQQLRLVIGQLQDFAERVKEDLAKADWSTRRDVIRTLVKRIEIDGKEVRVVYRVDLSLLLMAPKVAVCQIVGGVISPLLANLVLDRLDKFVEQQLISANTRGKRRKTNPPYVALSVAACRARKARNRKLAWQLTKAYQAMPSRDPVDPNFRRLWYVRYADDFLLGFIGPKAEALDVKRRLATFLRDELKLQLSDEKTLVTHAQEGFAKFLGYEVHAQFADCKHDRHGRRSINGGIGLRVPHRVVAAHCAKYLSNGKPIHLKQRVEDSAYSIIAQYQAEYAGIVQYYRLAYNLGAFSRLRWVTEVSLVKTLAAKLKLSCAQVYRRFRATRVTMDGTFKVLQVTVDRGPEKKPLEAHFGAVSLRWNHWAAIDESPVVVWSGRSELLQRLSAKRCELCGAKDQAIEVHHIRKLADLRGNSRWEKVMAARRRKTLVLCQHCHQAVHAGRYDGPALS